MSSQEQLKKELASIARRKENQTCADCRMQGPTWASFNLGLFMCMNWSEIDRDNTSEGSQPGVQLLCGFGFVTAPDELRCPSLFSPVFSAGHHRSMGTHISRVRSITLDNWDAPSVALMGSVGNARANSYFEARLAPHQRIHPGVDESVRGEFIRVKYANRAFYGTPAAGSEAAASEAAEVKPLSKMEQRQARLQAKAAAPVPTVTTSVAVSQPSAASARQTSVPLAASQSSMASHSTPTLFSGMAGPAAAVAAPAPVAAQSVATSAHVKQVPARVHSASPWVSKSEHQQVQQQLQQSQFHAHQQHAPAQQQPIANLLDLSAVSDTPAANPAPGHAVDDMFAGLSVSEHSASDAAAAAAAGAPTGSSSSNDLLSYYANEPASAPARSQHAQPSGAFNFMQADVAAAPAAFPTDLYAAPVQSQASSFSFLSSDAAPPAADSSSAFSFMSGGGGSEPAADGSDFGALLLAPAATGAFPIVDGGMGVGMSTGMGAPALGGVDSSFPAQANAALMPLGSVSQPYSASAAAPQPFLGAPAAIAALPHSYSQPNNLYAPQMNGFGQMQQTQQAQQQSYGYGGAVMQPGLVGNGALAPLPGSFGLPSTPQFTVQSVQATQRAHAVAAAQVANDPFAHIQVSPQPAQAQAQSQPVSSPFAGAISTKPKQPGQCEADGCEGKSVSRGLCIQHVRGPAAGAAAPAAVAASSPISQPAASSSFDFLATQSPPQQQQQQQPLSTGGESSSFSFLL